MSYEKYEDKVREDRHDGDSRFNKYSPYCDFIYYRSSIDPNIRLAMRVLKPAKPSHILVTTHGWHMSIPQFLPMDQPQQEYIILEVDMRGRAFSDGKADCNGWELLDIIDAVRYARKHYASFILNPDTVYFEGGSGGGGNGYALVGKFPDFFAATTVLCGITDYALWYEHDQIGEFRDELDVWIGCSPEQNKDAYAARSGLFLLPNLLTPLFAVHGETDERIGVEHARIYAKQVHELKLDHRFRYLELAGVGTRDHWGNAKELQMEAVRQGSEKNRAQNRCPIEIPEQGTFIVAGYLITKKFSIILDSLDHVAEVRYDLERNEFKVTGNGVRHYSIYRGPMETWSSIR